MSRRKTKIISRLNIVLSSAIICLLSCYSYGNNPYEKELEKLWGLFDEFCISCHNFSDNAGGLALEVFWPDSIATEPAMWEKVVKKLSVSMMPPPGEKRPSQANIDKMVTTLEQALDYVGKTNPHPGYVGLHRINRNEYANAIRDLLGLDIDPTLYLPRDDKSHGFSNNASVLKISPSFLEQSLLAAREISTLAFGDAKASPTEVVYSAPANAGQYVHIDGLPFGTRGGMLVEHNFPVDGEYLFSLNDLVGAVYVWGVLEKNEIVITIDGEKVFQQSVGGEDDLRAVDLEQAQAVSEINQRFKNIPINVSAGPHQVGVSFLPKTAAVSNELLHDALPVTGMSMKIQGNSYGPDLNKLIIKGPYKNFGISSTPSREKIFSCYPANKEKAPNCAKEIVSNLSSKAFRRKVEDTEIDALMAIYNKNEESLGFEKALQQSLMAILVNPKFLYRATHKVNHEESAYISDIDLASRLSFFLWASVPDTELLTLAKEKKLSQPKILRQQVNRMLADPKANALVDQFAFQWLNINGLDQLEPNTSLYPYYTPDLAEDFKTEIFLFIQSIFQENESITKLLSAKHSFVNERLALHYGLKGVRGGKFQRIQWNDQQRFGLFGKGAVLMTTSYSDRTSPVLRGAYVLEKFMGVIPPAPPPDVEAFPENKIGSEFKSVRDRLEFHRQNKSCNACHGIIDPPGLVLENFNAVGKWRDKDIDAAALINASGELMDGTQLESPADLRKYLLEKPEKYVQTFTEKLMAYALGRGIEYYDMPKIREIVKQSKKDDFRFNSIVQGIVFSPAFLQTNNASMAKN